MCDSSGRKLSVSSAEYAGDDEMDSEVTSTGEGPGAVADRDILDVVKHKIDRLTDTFVEHCKLLTEIKEELNNAATNSLLACSALVSETILGFIVQRAMMLAKYEVKVAEITGTSQDTGADVRNRIHEEVIRQLHIELAPMQRCRDAFVANLTRAIKNAFAELEKIDGSTSAVEATLAGLRRAIQQHENFLPASQDECLATLRAALQTSLREELMGWRNEVCISIGTEAGFFNESKMDSVVKEKPAAIELKNIQSPPVPGELTPIDRLMLTAKIKRQIENGDLSGGFGCALAAGDLTLVTSACRAADPDLALAVVSQPALLSLSQQLSTDMVLDTQLKCRYLESALANLNIEDSATREHWPSVAAQVNANLRRFLGSYPGHLCADKICHIIKVIDSLTKR